MASAALLRVRRQTRNPRIVDGPADGEVVEALERTPAHSQHVVHRVVEVTTDARRAHARCLLYVCDYFNPVALEHALAGGLNVIEVPIDRAANTALHATLFAAVSEAAARERPA